MEVPMNFTTLKTGWNQLSLISKIYSLIFILSGLGSAASIMVGNTILVVFELVFVTCIWIASIMATAVILRDMIKHPTSLPVITGIFAVPTFALFGTISGAGLLTYIFQATTLPVSLFFQVALAITLLGTALATAFTSKKEKI